MSFLCPNSNISRVKVDVIRAIIDPVQVKYSFSQVRPNCGVTSEIQMVSRSESPLCLGPKIQLQPPHFEILYREENESFPSASSWGSSLLAVILSVPVVNWVVVLQILGDKESFHFTIISACQHRMRHVRPSLSTCLLTPLSTLLAAVAQLSLVDCVKK